MSTNDDAVFVCIEPLVRPEPHRSRISSIGDLAVAADQVEPLGPREEGLVRRVLLATAVAGKPCSVARIRFATSAVSGRRAGSFSII